MNPLTGLIHLVYYHELVHMLRAEHRAMRHHLWNLAADAVIDEVLGTTLSPQQWARIFLPDQRDF